MSESLLKPRPDVPNCTGHACPEREQCLRYLRPAWRASKHRVTGEWIVQRWASFDIERQHFGDCQQRIAPPHRQMAQAMATAR